MDKYRNKETKILGTKFDSKREAARYTELVAMWRAGDISEPICKPSFELNPAQVACSGKKERGVTYIADFSYRRRDGSRVVEDVKSPVTAKLPAYIIKRKLMLRVHGIEVVEIF